MITNYFITKLTWREEPESIPLCRIWTTRYLSAEGPTVWTLTKEGTAQWFLMCDEGGEVTTTRHPSWQGVRVLVFNHWSKRVTWWRWYNAPAVHFDCSAIAKCFPLAKKTPNHLSDTLREVFTPTFKR